MEFVAKITADISEFVTNMRTALTEAEQLGGRLQKVGGALTIGLTAPLTALGAAALSSFGKIESLRNGLTALTGSADQTAIQLERLTKLTDIPGLDLESLVKGTINLQTIGWTAENAEKAMSGLGNAIALIGGGQEDFKGALYGLQQLANTEFPLGEDLNILKERLPQITPLLKEAFGASRSDDLQKLGVTSQQVIDAIVNGLDKLPKAAVGLNGSFTMLKNGIQISLADIGSAINDTFDISGIVQDVTSNLKSLTEWFKKLSPEARKAIIVIAGLAAAIGPLLVGLGTIIKIAPLVGAAFSAMTGPIGIAIAVIGSAATAIIIYWDDIKKGVLNSVSAIQRGVAGVFNKMSGWADKLGFDEVSKQLKDLGGEFNTFANNTSQKASEVGAALKTTSSSTKELNTNVATTAVNSNSAALGMGNLSKATNDFAAAQKRVNEEVYRDSLSIFDQSLFDIKKKYDEIYNVATNLGTIALAKSNQQMEVFKATLDSVGYSMDKLSSKNKTSNIAGIKASNSSALPIIPTIDSNALKNQVGELRSDLKTSVGDLNLDFSEMITEGISNTMTALGSAIANGENVVSALGNALLGTFGSIIKQLGEQLVALGTGMLAAKLAIKNPFLALAAGAAMIALGSAFSASASKTLNNMGSGGYAQSSVSSSNVSTPMQTGSLYNNSRQVVELKLRNTELVGAVNLNNNRNNRLS